MTYPQRLAAIQPRTLILGTLWTMMIISLVCSLSFSYGHADSPIAASADEIEPLAAGEAAPRFVVRAPDGEAFDFDPRSLERPVIVITFRGGWCPFCNMHLSELRNVLPEINELGVDVLFLSGDRPDMLYSSLAAETQEDIDGRGYELYSDADANAAIAFGIAFRAADSTINRRLDKGQDIEGSSMQAHGVLPVPAVFAIDRDGEIAFAYANADYRIRVPANQLLEVAESIAGP